MNLSLIKIVHDTMVDGPGMRTAVYCAGCPNACPGCHNPQTWDINAGAITPVEQILEDILDDDLADVTFTGGDPMFQPEAFTELARLIKEQSNKTIWCYTGYVYEFLTSNPQQRELLNYIDVLVDGPFIQALKDETLMFRGSRNQRLIDVQASLKTHNVVEFAYNPYPDISPIRL